MNKKKLLALLMALVMTLTLVPVTAFAEDDVSNEYFGTASVYDGDTLLHDYSSLGEAINAATTGQKIILSKGQFEISGTPAEGVTISGQGPEKTTIYTSASGNDITNKHVTIENVKIDGEAASGVSYAGAINLRGDGATINNCVISGGGQDTWGASVAIFMNPGEKAVIRNSQIGGAFRAVFLGSTSGGVDIENCVIDNTIYCINVDGDNKYEVVLNVSDSTLKGWTSYGDAVTEATFTNVTFEKGSYDYLCPYSNTTLDRCTFDSKFELGVRDGLTHTLKDCRVREDNGSYSAITSKNYARIIDVTENYGTIIVIEPAGVAKIGDTPYASLEEAFTNAEDGQTITLLADCAGNGIIAPQGKFTNGLTVDFADHTYTVDGDTVGSTGTETNGFQLLKDNKITFKNGTITSEKAKILVQNYSDLTLKGMTLTLNNSGYTSAYTLSNNNGNVVIDGSTITANPAGGYAFDVCRFSSYPSVNVTVTGNSTINGNVEISASGNDAKDGFSLTLTSGTITGDIVLDASAKAAMAATPNVATITKDDGFTQTAPAGYKWDETGKLVEVTYVAQIGTTKYETLQAAVNAVPNDGKEVTITILGDITDGGVGLFKNGKGNIPAATNKNIVFDFDGHTVTIGEPLVGSTGTESQSFHLEAGNTVTLRNGTLVSDKAKILIQNYCDLTLDEMTVGRTTDKYSYTVSCNNGTIKFTNGTVINATSTGYAFDVCVTNYYPDGAHITIDDATINGNIQYDVWGSIPAAGNKASLTITGGTFNGAFVVENALTEIAKNCTSISGGKFSTNPSAYVADGYKAATISDGDYRYQVGKVVANATVTGDSTTSNEATYTVGTVVKDEENKDIVDSETTNMQVAIKGTTDSDANAYADVTTGEENKRPVGAAALIQLASDKVGDIVAAAVEAAGAKATDNMSINVVLVSDAGTQTMDAQDSNKVAKVTYEIHPEAIVYSVENAKKTVIGSYHITNDQLKENTSFTVTLPVDPSWNEKTINITHTKEDGELETIQAVATNGSVTFTVSEFSEFELEPVSLDNDGYGSNYVTQSTLILDGYINVAFYVHLDNAVVNDSTVAIVLEQTSHMGTIKEMHRAISQCEPTGNNVYKVVFPVAAKDMDVKIKLYLKDEFNHIIPLTNTSYTTGDGGVEYAVTDYLANKANSSDQGLRELVEALYAYHETSRFYFDHRDGERTYVRSGDHDPAALPTNFAPTAKSVTVGDGFEGLSIQSTSLMLVSETTVRFHFKLASGHNISEYTFRCGNTVLTPQKDGSTYYVDVPRIAAKDLDKQQTVTVTQNTNATYTVTYGPFNYIKANANKTSNGLNNLVAAIYWYQVKAAAYFANN